MGIKTSANHRRRINIDLVGPLGIKKFFLCTFNYIFACYLRVHVFFIRREFVFLLCRPDFSEYFQWRHMHWNQFRKFSTSHTKQLNRDREKNNMNEKTKEETQKQTAIYCLCNLYERKILYFIVWNYCVAKGNVLSYIYVFRCCCCCTFRIVPSVHAIFIGFLLLGTEWADAQPKQYMLLLVDNENMFSLYLGGAELKKMRTKLLSHLASVAVHSQRKTITTNRNENAI